MRVIVFGDIHDNYKTIDNLPGDGDLYLCMGDICDRNPRYASAAIEKLAEIESKKDFLCVLGRHDSGIFSDDDIQPYFQALERKVRPDDNSENISNVYNMRNELKKEYKDWLMKWSATNNKKTVTFGHRYPVTAVHDSLERVSTVKSRELGLGGKYKSKIVYPYLASANFEKDTEFSILFVGHSHVPMVWRKTPDIPEMKLLTKGDGKEKIKRNERYIINTGQLCGKWGWMPGVGSVAPFYEGLKGSYGILDIEKRDFWLEFF